MCRGPNISPTTIDMGRLDMIESALEPIVAAENVQGGNKSAGEAWSRDAGTFYCNEALWRTTNTIRTLRIRAPLNKVTPF